MASEFCCSNPGTAVSAVILDLDGTLLDTGEVASCVWASVISWVGWSPCVCGNVAESATKGTVGEFLAKYGKELDKEREGRKRLGMTLEVTAASIVRDYDLPLTPDQFVAEIMPMYQEKWSRARAMPGADRLIKHLYKHGVSFALASNSLREYIDEKIAHHEGWKDYFSVILGRDQVKSGKPAPDLFLEAARKMGVDAAQCVVIEDSLVGVKAAKAAKMSVVAVPSPSETDCSLFADSVLSSLLEFQPEQWGLPPFDELENGESLIESVHECIQLEENGSIQEIFGNGTG